MQALANFGNYAAELLTTTLKVAYPTYASYKAIKTETSSDDTIWLIYWVVIAVESFIEAYLLPFVSWVPFFMLLRLLFYIWLQLPVFNGSILLFRRYIEPFFEKHSKEMNAVTSTDSDDAKDMKAQVKQEISAAYKEILEAIEKGE